MKKYAKNILIIKSGMSKITKNPGTKNIKINWHKINRKNNQLKDYFFVNKRMAKMQ